MSAAETKCFEAAASEAAPRGNLVQPMVRTAVTDEAEAAQKAEENGLAKEAAEADAAKKSEEECAAREAAELARKTEEERQARGATAEATRMAEEQRLPLETAHKAKKVEMHCRSLQERLIPVGNCSSCNS